MVFSRLNYKLLLEVSSNLDIISPQINEHSSKSSNNAKCEYQHAWGDLILFAKKYGTNKDLW